MDLGLKGKRALVMAASRGLGYASALGLAREGCHLVICSRDQQRIEAAADAIRRETGAQVTALVSDVSSSGEAQRLVDAAVAEYGGLEIVVHNAFKGGRAHRLEDLDLELWDENSRTAAWGSYYAAQITYPHLAAAGARTCQNGTAKAASRRADRCQAGRADAGSARTHRARAADRKAGNPASP